MNARKPLREDRRSKWLIIAKEHLGITAEEPLVAQLLKWIADEDLAMALHETGLLKAGTGQLMDHAAYQRFLGECAELLARNCVREKDQGGLHG